MIAADSLSVNTIRGLCMDMVQQANSGHPGTPTDIAPLAYTLRQRSLRFDPSDPIWPHRDRLVLFEGHASVPLKELPTKVDFTAASVTHVAQEMLAGMGGES